MPDVPLEVLHEDDDVIAVSKPAGMLVIPGRTPEGQSLRDLVDERLKPLGQRAWVVHRLDRGTSGVVLFARHALAHQFLNLRFDARDVDKVYLALVDGDLQGRGKIDEPLHPARRGKMRPALPGEAGLPAWTGWKALETFGDFTWLEVRPQTGRQHQVRVHLKFIGHPLAFDPDYGNKQPLVFSGTARLDRTPLHAASIRIPHPNGKGALRVEAPLAPDLVEVLDFLRKHWNRAEELRTR